MRRLQPGWSVEEPLSGARPYRGLAPFAEADAAYFFGRLRDRRVIADNLLAARLTLLYGPSGVGKSSVLRAGVTHDLQQLARQNATEQTLPEWVVVVFDQWTADPLGALEASIRDAVSWTLDGPVPEPTPEAPGLVPLLEAWTASLEADLLIVLDQFEQYLLRSGPGGDAFADELARAINRRNLAVNFLIGIREDALAGLDLFKGRIPRLFDNRLRLDHLDREAARAAIVGPLEERNRHLSADARPVGIEPALVEAVLSQVRPGRVDLAHGAGAVGAERATADRIEAPYLQLVIARLWHEEARRGSDTLRLATFEQLGSAQTIVREHLNEALATLTAKEQEVAADVVRHLVTQSGVKIAHTAGDLASLAERPEAAVAPVLEKLAGDVRILTPSAPLPGDQAGPRYALFHDILGRPVLDWLRAARDRRRLVRAWRTAAISGVVALMMLGFALFTVYQWEVTRSRELAASAVKALEHDVDRSVLLAVAAMDVKRTPEAELALRKVVVESRHSHVRRVIVDVEDRTGVNEAAYSPDGAFVATATNRVDEAVRMWDAATGQRVLILKGHVGPVYGVSYSPDGRLLATAGNDRTARVWDASTGRQLYVLLGHTTSVWRARFSSDGRYVVTASLDGTLRRWDLAAPGHPTTIVMRGHGDRVWTAEFSPDGRRILSASADGTAREWDATTGTAIRILRVPGGPLRSAAYSPDGRRLVTASRDGARVWAEGTAHELQEVSFLRWHTGSVWDARFSPDSKLVVTGADDNTAGIWDAESGRELAMLRAHTGRITSAAFSLDGKSILTASDDSTVRVWDVALSDLPRLVPAHHDAAALSVAYSSDGRYAVTAGGDKTARIWEAGSWQPVGKPLMHQSQILSAVFSPDGRRVVTGSLDGEARIWDLATGDVTPPLRHIGAVNQAAFSPSGTKLLTGSDDGRAVIWALGPPLRAERVLSIPQGLNRQILGAAYSPDGLSVATAGRDGAVRLWEASTGAVVAELPGHNAPVWRVAYSRDGSTLATVGGDRTARIWDVRFHSQLHVLSEHGAEVRAVAYSWNGRLLVTGGVDGIVRVWDAQTGRLLMELPQQRGRLFARNRIFSATFSPDDHFIATASEDGVIQIDECPVYLCDPDVATVLEYARSRAQPPSGSENQRLGVEPASR